MCATSTRYSGKRKGNDLRWNRTCDSRADHLHSRRQSQRIEPCRGGCRQATSGWDRSSPSVSLMRVTCSYPDPESDVTQVAYLWFREAKGRAPQPTKRQRSGAEKLGRGQIEQLAFRSRMAPAQIRRVRR